MDYLNFCLVKRGDPVYSTSYYPFIEIIEERFSLEMLPNIGISIFLSYEEAKTNQDIGRKTNVNFLS
jgi:hypothetical protein